MAAQKAALVAIFDPNSACVQRQQASDRARRVGGPRVPREQEEGELALGGSAKPAKLQTSGRKRRQISRLVQAFQHRHSNMPSQARREGQFSAILAAPGRQQLDPAELERAGRHQARDRRPKLLPRTRSWTLQIAISGL